MEQTPSEKEIFYTALEITDAEDRCRLLDSACHGDTSLRRKVEGLLAAHEDALLQDPALIAELRTSEDDVRIGQTIDHFKLRERIGEGGFGVVYMADQVEPIQRRVALKIIKAGMDTKQVIGRFEAERQALALMDHPNIATVLDAGSTDTGRPYFVMELVRGIPVTEYCDERSLSTDERLKIFMEICSAIQHAHQKGIIHRDIKPSNILVTTNGDRPVPKIIDFGIAKATQGRLTDKTLITQFRQFMGTPAYTSPEQTQMSAVDVDTRSDIYSMGVLLYELLTGKTPLDSQKLLEGGMNEMFRRVREVEPSTPSARLSSLTLEERTTVARNRRTESMALRSKLRGDLDWIVMKALEKDRSLRYETANALKLDIHRYLRNEPVSAAAPSTAYKISRFVRRNKNSITVAGLIVALLITGTVASTWQAMRATRQAQRATIAEQDAERNSIQADVLRERAQASERTARRRQYAAEMIIAQRGIGGLNSRNTWELLQKQIPKPNEPDFRGFEWRSLWNEYRRELFTLTGHTDEMRSIDFSPDGHWLASGSTDGTARLWSVPSRRQVWQFLAGTHCNHVAFSPDGQLLLTVFFQRKSILWDVSDPTKPRKVRESDASGIFSPNGKTVVGGGNPLKQWSLTGEVLHEFVDPDIQDDESNDRTHLGRIWSWAMSPDGGQLVTSGGDSKVKVWDVGTGELAFTLRGDTTDVLEVAFVPGGDMIFTASGYGAVRAWDNTGKELRWLQLEKTPLDNIEFTKDSKSMVISERFGRLHVLDTETWESIAAFDSSGGAMLLKCSPSDPGLAVTAASDGVIRFWDTLPTKSILDHASPVRSLEFSPDGRMLAVGMANGVVQFWDVPRKSKVFATNMTKTVNPYKFPPMALTSYKPDFVAFSRDSSKAAIIGPENVVTVWDIQEKHAETVIISPHEHTGFWSVIFCQDGMHLYTGTAWRKERNGVLVWRLTDPTVPVTELGHPGDWGVGSMALSSDGTILASGHADVKLWSVPQRQRLRSLSFPELTDMERGALSLCFSPDDKWLAVGDAADSVWIWDTRTWHHDTLSLRHNVCCVAFSPEGDRIVAADMSGLTKLWDLETRQVVATYHGSVADFSPNGTLLAIGCEDHLGSHLMPEAGRVRLYYAPPLAEIDRDRDALPQ